MSQDHNPYEAPSVPVDPPIHADHQAPTGGGVYVPGGGRATATVVFLYINLALDLSSAVASGFLLPLLSDARAGDIAALSSLKTLQIVVGVFAILQLGALIGCAIAFCMWFYRAYANLLGLGTTALQHSPGWAPGSFFVPFLNLVRPFQIAKEIWLSSRNDGSLATGPVGPWWACFLISSFLGNIGARMSGSADTVSAGLVVSILSDLLAVGAAIFAVKVVRGIEARQAETAKQRYQPSGYQPSA